VEGTEWPVQNRSLTRQDRALRSTKPSVHYQLSEAPILRQPSESLTNPSVRSSQEEILHEPELLEPDNLVLEDDNVFLSQVAEPNSQIYNY